MTPEQVIELARKVGAGEPGSLYGRTDYVVLTKYELGRFATLIRDKYRAELLVGSVEPVAEVCHSSQPHSILWSENPLKISDGMELHTADQLAAAVLRERNAAPESHIATLRELADTKQSLLDTENQLATSQKLLSQALQDLWSEETSRNIKGPI